MDRLGMLKLKPGIYRINGPLEIGSMRLVGARNFVVFSALTALYRYGYNLFVRYVLKQNFSARAAEIIHISASFDGGTDK